MYQICIRFVFILHGMCLYALINACLIKNLNLKKLPNYKSSILSFYLYKICLRQNYETYGRFFIPCNCKIVTVLLNLLLSDPDVCHLCLVANTTQNF